MESEKVKEIKKALEDNADREHYNSLWYMDDCKCITVAYADILTLINELESENERLNKSDTSKEESSIEYYNLYKDLKRKNKDLNELCELQRVSISENFVKENQLKDRIAELEGEITKSDIINSKLEMDIEFLNKQNIDLEIDRDYYQEQFNEQEDFYVEWNKQQLKQFAERLKENDKIKVILNDGWIFSYVEICKAIDETLKEFVEL